MPSKEVATSSPKDCSVKEIDRALSAVALFDGNTRKAARALKNQGLDIPRSTLRDWVTGSRKNRYMELRDELLPEIHAKVAEEHQELARANMKAEAKYVERILKVLPDLEPRDLTTAARNLATAAGIHQDKSSALRGLHQPAVAINFSITDQIRSYGSLGGQFFDENNQPISQEQALAKAKGSIEGTATDLSDESTESEVSA